MQDVTPAAFQRAPHLQLPLLLVSREEKPSLVQPLGECSWCHPNGTTGRLAHRLDRGEGRLQVQVEIVPVGPPGTITLRLPFDALVFPGTHRPLAPAPGFRMVRNVPRWRRHMREASGQGGSQQVDEAPRRLLANLMLCLPRRGLAERLPDSLPERLGLVMRESLDIDGKAQEDPPAQREVRHGIRRPCVSASWWACARNAASCSGICCRITSIWPASHCT